MANVLSCLALFMALSGVAYAATLGKNAVKTKNIANGAVTTPKLKNRGVTAGKLADGSVIAAKIAPANVTSSALATGAVRSSALGGSVVTTAKLKNDAVTGEKIASGAVTNSKLGPDAVATGKVQDGAVTAAKLSPAFLAQLAKDVTYMTGNAGPADTVTTTKTANAECPAGKAAIGGGAQVTGATTTVAITKSAPSSAFGTVAGLPRTWTATATAIAPEATAWSLEVHAVCAEF